MSEITQNTIILDLTIGTVTTSRRVPKGQVIVKQRADGEQTEEQEERNSLDQDALRVSKIIFDSPELTNVLAFLKKVRRYIQDNALPTETLKNGMYLFAREDIPKIEAKIAEFRTELEPLKEVLRAAYPDMIVHSIERLKELVDYKDFPDIDVLLNKLTIQFQYLAFQVPREALHAISADLVAREEQKIVAKYAGFSEQIERAWLTDFGKMVDKLLEKLRPSADGKKKKITDKAAEELDTFFELFQKRNVTGFSELTPLIERARDLVNGVSPDELKQDNVRNFVTSKMDEIRSSLDALVETRGGRRIVLLDPDEEIHTPEGDTAHAA